jgi:hypothetical protein
MYQLRNLTDGNARIVSDNPPYDSTFNVADEAEAVRIVLGLNRPPLLESLADHRFAFETDGLILDNGLRVSTDRESQAQLSSIYTDLTAGLIPDADWKAKNGWQRVDLETIAPIVKAVAVHRRACFRGERQVQASIDDAATIADIEAIDIQQHFATAYEQAFTEVMASA